MGTLGLLGLAIIGGMLGNVAMAVALFALRERRRRGEDEFTRLPESRSPYLAVRFWRSLRI